MRANAEADRLRASMLYFGVTGILFLGVFTLNALVHATWSIFWVLVVFLSLTVALVWASYRHYALFVCQSLGMTIVVGMYYYLLWDGAYHNTGYLWCFAFAPVPYFILGWRYGALSSGLIILIGALGLFWPNFPLLLAEYSYDTKVRFVASSVALSVLSMVQAFARARSDDRVFSLTYHIQELARTDDLTEIPNRRALGEVLDSRLMDLGRYADHFGLLLFDLDHFKQVNDNHGHAVGDRVLIEVSRLISNILRKTDTVGRWGGEEFLVVLPHTDEKHTRSIAEKIRLAVAGHVVEISEVKVAVSVSIGATVVKVGDNLEAVLKKVDDALYQAKDAGRNCVVFST